jgi:hypothetical protein
MVGDETGEPELAAVCCRVHLTLRHAAYETFILPDLRSR